MTTLDCVDAALYQREDTGPIATACSLGKARVGGVDLNNLRMRRALSAVLALAPSPVDFSTAHFQGQGSVDDQTS